MQIDPLGSAEAVRVGVFFVGAEPGKESLPLAIAGAHRYSTALRSRCVRIVIGKTFAKRQPDFFAVQNTVRPTRHHFEGSIQDRQR